MGKCTAAFLALLGCDRGRHCGGDRGTVTAQRMEEKTPVEEKGAASAGMGEVSPEQGDFPARCSGALREGMSGLAPACRARLCWDAQEEDCESRAILPWGSPFPVLSALGFDTSVHDSLFVQRRPGSLKRKPGVLNSPSCK